VGCTATTSSEQLFLDLDAAAIGAYIVAVMALLALLALLWGVNRQHRAPPVVIGHSLYLGG
jgi:hypothetical protein